MSNKFSDFCDYEKNEEKIENFKKENPKQYNDMEDLINKYKNLNNNELLNEFLKESKKGIENGSINKEYITNVKNTLMPYLTAEQIEYLNKMLEMINE